MHVGVHGIGQLNMSGKSTMKSPFFARKGMSGTARSGNGMAGKSQVHAGQATMNAASKSRINEQKRALKRSQDESQYTYTKSVSVDKNGEETETVIRHRTYANYGQSAVQNMKGYSSSLTAGRTNSKKTSLAMKKLRYNYKSLSSAIMRSKTSTSAREVASKAKREIMRLKRERGKEGIDEEELQAAITHARAMERIARKKARHLEEEELCKAAGGPCMGNMEDSEKVEESDEKAKIDETDVADETDAASDSYAAGDEFAYEDADYVYDDEFAYEDELIASTDELMDIFNDAMMESMDDLTEEVMDEMMEAFKEFMEEMGFEDIEGSAGAEKDMDPADFKMMKIKHRNSEMKAMVKADAEYLKVIFKHMQEGSAVPMVSGGSHDFTADLSNIMSAGESDIGASVDLVL